MSGEDDDLGPETPVVPTEGDAVYEGEPDPSAEAFGGGHRRRHRKRRKSVGESISHLNLTPMMDIMTMLLVFLVKSFEAAPENININAALRPPQSTTEVTMRPATKVTITKDEILVDDKPVIAIADVAAATEQTAIPALRDGLVERADHLRAVEQRGGAPFEGKLMVVADETTPYAIVTSVLVTAGEAKFAEYKLVVMQKTE